jgi:ABC-type branched-subunit amino acid transport system substrate-binding protein
MRFPSLQRRAQGGDERRGRSARGRWATVAVVFLLLAGCPTRFDPRAAPVKPSPDPAADAAFREARGRFEAGAVDDARAKLEAFVARYPGDPLRPVAETFLGRIALGKRDFARARALLTGPAASSDPGVAEPARYHLGLAVHRLGQHAEARRLLRPFAGRVTGAEAADLYGTLADVGAKLGDVPGALADYEAFYRVARDPERAWIRERAEALAAVPPAAQLPGLHGAAPRGSLAAAVLGNRLAAMATDPQRRQALLADVRSARQAFGLAVAGAAWPGSEAEGDARIVGCLVPLTGKNRPVGESAMRGALLGANAQSGAGAERVQLAVRDTGGDPVRAAQAARDLAGEGVIAIVGPIDRHEAAAAARAAESLSVPLVALDVADTTAPQAGVFHALPTSASRAAALATYAAGQGVRQVAVAAPDNAYGRKQAAAFTAAARAAGLQVVAEERYDPQATSFGPLVNRLKARQFGGLFVPDRAAVLELLAPALARAGVWSRPAGGPAGKKLRTIVLLSTAEGLSTKLVRAAGRYVQGAVLAPGFYADAEDERVAPFVAGYRDAYGGDPGLFEAFGHDAVRAVRAAVAGGARTRADVRARLQRGALHPGVTGHVTFGADGHRLDPPLLYQVDGERIRLLRPATKPR